MADLVADERSLSREEAGDAAADGAGFAGFDEVVAPEELEVTQVYGEGRVKPRTPVSTLRCSMAQGQPRTRWTRSGVSRLGKGTPLATARAILDEAAAIIAG